jgi:L-asparaginase
MIIATGGTIAGVQDDPKDPSRYRAGSLSAEEITASVPELPRHAEVETLQFSNMPSTRIKPRDWVRLSATINDLFASREDLAGVVVTHGTDRLEETAFFLHLTVDSDRPVVIVGAQRPATNPSADGPANLLAAVRTAAAPASRDRGVMVVMDERILSAREVKKEYPRVGGFAAGRIGLVGSNGPEYLYRPTRPHTHRSDFKVTEDTVLPAVDMVFSYSGGLGPTYTEPPPGVVVTTTNMTCAEQLALQVLARAGTAVVTAFPTGENLRRIRPVESSAPERMREGCSELEGDPRWEGPWIPPMPAPMMTPQKARILLMLALAQTTDRDRLAEIITRY